MRYVASFEKLDFESWPRAKHYRLFSAANSPYLGMTSEVDVTDLVRAKRERSLSPFIAMLYAVTRAANEVVNFRYRWLEGSPVLFSRVDPSWTLMEKGDDLFYLASCEYAEDFAVFAEAAAEAGRRSLAAKDIEGEGGARVDFLYLTSIPWRGFSELTHPCGVPDKEGIPRIGWGRWREGIGGRFFMPVNVLANHAFVDGLHLAKFFERVESVIAEVL